MKASEVRAMNEKELQVAEKISHDYKEIEWICKHRFCIYEVHT